MLKGPGENTAYQNMSEGTTLHLGATSGVPGPVV